MNRIKEVRMSTPISAEKLAHAMGTGRSTIMKLENGHRTLTVEWLERIAWHLKVSPVDLVHTNSVASVQGREGMLYVVDDSMDLVARPGQRIIIDIKDKNLIDGELYLFFINGEILFRRYRFEEGPERLEPESSNPMYLPLFITTDIFTQVFGRIHIPPEASQD